MILVVDTALDHAQSALVAAGGLRGASFAPAQGDAEAVVDRAEAALAAAGASWGDVDRVIVTVGPGSFTGVRVGIAFAKGVAFARGIPAVGVTTLEAIAATAGRDAVAVVDARHGQVFCAAVRGGVAAQMQRTSADAAVRLAAEADLPLAGSAAALAACGGGALLVARLDPLAIANVAGRLPRSPPSAVYLAPVDAMPQRHKALARASM